MKKTTKAILTSAFIFPGIGQFILKRYVHSIVFIASALWATGVIFYYIINISMAISQRILNGEIEPNILLIRSLIVEQQASLNIPLVNIATWVLIAVWLISIVDAYLAGKAQKNAGLAKG